MRTLQSLGSAIVVGSVFSFFLVGLLGATWPFAIFSSVVLGVGIVAVVATRSSEMEGAANDAWLEAAPDLPPASDRRAMEAAQATMPGPEKTRRGGDPAAHPGSAASGDAVSDGAVKPGPVK
jgi:hypothetical protein